MTNNNPADLLRKIKVETGSLVCLGCGYEHNCCIHGCAIMGAAADRIAHQTKHIRALQMAIEDLRSQNKQLREASALLTKESVEPPVELAEADRAGRLVVLPCKVGDTVHRLQYIERDAAIAAAKHAWAKNLEPSQYIEAVPAADVAPVVHGRWIDDESGIIICSECGRGYNLVPRYTHYCPNCGAKMDGDANG